MNYMSEALKEAKKAYEIDEVPVGAVIIKEGKIIAKAHNLKEKKQLATAHVYYGSEESIVNESTKENYTYIESGECSQILKDFFKKLREDKHN